MPNDDKAPTRFAGPPPVAQCHRPRRRLVTGQMIGERIVIESGLQAGDRVIVAGLQKVRPGVPVKVAQAKPAGAGQAATPNKAE